MSGAPSSGTVEVEVVGGCGDCPPENIRILGQVVDLELRGADLSRPMHVREAALSEVVNALLAVARPDAPLGAMLLEVIRDNPDFVAWLQS